MVSSYCLLNDKYEIQDWGFMNSSVPVPYSTSALHFMVSSLFTLLQLYNAPVVVLLLFFFLGYGNYSGVLFNPLPEQSW